MITNHPSFGNGTISGSGGRVARNDAARYWRVAGRYILARSREHAIERYRDGEGSTKRPDGEYIPPARCVRTVA